MWRERRKDTHTLYNIARNFVFITLCRNNYLLPHSFAHSLARSKAESIARKCTMCMLLHHKHTEAIVCALFTCCLNSIILCGIGSNRSGRESTVSAECIESLQRIKYKALDDFQVLWGAKCFWQLIRLQFRAVDRDRWLRRKLSLFLIVWRDAATTALSQMTEWDFVNRRKAYLQPNSACQLQRLRLSIRCHACHAKKADLTPRKNGNINEQFDFVLLSMPLVSFAPLCLHLTFRTCDAACLFLSLSFSHADLHWAPWKGDSAFHSVCAKCHRNCMQLVCNRGEKQKLPLPDLCQVARHRDRATQPGNGNKRNSTDDLLFLTPVWQ